MKVILYLWAILVIVASCDKILLGEDEPVISLEENLQSPPLLNDGWEVSDLSTQHVNEQTIKRLITEIHQDPGNIHSLLIFRNNKLVSESYFDGWHRNRLHTLRSDSKSFISTLVGIAVDKGQIAGVEQKVFDFFPEYAPLNNAQKSEIKIRHILTMSAGLQWDESTYFNQNDYRNDEYAIERSNDRLGYLFKKEMVAVPGTAFLYNSALPVLQSAIIKKATGDDIETYARKYLFQPLQITNYFWRMNKDGYSAIAPLFLTPRDMGKLGQLYLDSGKWKGQQVVSKNWIATASSSIVTNTASFSGSRPGTGYGYNWWTEKFDINNNIIQAIAAEGTGGQYIFVVPALRAVVVFTGGNFDTPQGAPFGIMNNVILPAL